LQPNASCRLVVLYILALPIVDDSEELHCGKYRVAGMTAVIPRSGKNEILRRTTRTLKACRATLRRLVIHCDRTIRNEKMPFVIARNDRRHFTYLFDDRLTMR